MWAYPINYKGLEVEIDSGWSYLNEVVGFYVRDEPTIKAIRSHDERIFDVLNLMVDEIEELSYARWASDNVAINHWKGEKSLDEYEQIIRTVITSQYSDEATKQKMKKELEWVIDSRQKQAEKKVKKIHSQRRRSDFAKNYDQLMLALIERDGYKCAVCGTIENLTIDHVIPLSKGGSDEIKNLRILCRAHNSKKSDKITEPDMF